ncbi:Protein CBG25462 [Caenorhabditis briggsae]|uniref:Protein CBG25462 n=1 Tax=Caenorhabditis briggsae TaxID=6238 RepID=B6ILZ6_CAEBR|nr:Protein CBG25462 [Caenorhabditis briggsae]CAS00926.1 Protein CBG25462 [Caenorhabditis briggsae]
MSRFLESCKCIEAPMCLHKEGFFYLLNETVREFHPNLKNVHCPKEVLKKEKAESLHVSIDKSNHRLRMYGSLEELSENITIYKNFPGNSQYFGLSGEPYQTNPIIYKSLKNDEKYIVKPDLFVIFQNMITLLPGGNLMEIILRVVPFLKRRHASVQKTTEFVKFDEKRIEEIYKKMDEKFNKIVLVIKGGLRSKIFIALKCFKKICIFLNIIAKNFFNNP